MEEQSTHISRRNFLKVTAASGLALSAAWAVPSIATINARAAYSAVTGTTTQCYSATIVDCTVVGVNTILKFRLCNSCAKATSHVAFSKIVDANGIHNPKSPGSSYTSSNVSIKWNEVELITYDSGNLQKPFDGIKFGNPNADLEPPNGCTEFEIEYLGLVVKDGTVMVYVNGKHGSDPNDNETFPITIPAP